MSAVGRQQLADEVHTTTPAAAVAASIVFQMASPRKARSAAGGWSKTQIEAERRRDKKAKAANYGVVNGTRPGAKQMATSAPAPVMASSRSRSRQCWLRRIPPSSLKPTTRRHAQVRRPRLRRPTPKHIRVRENPSSPRRWIRPAAWRVALPGDTTAVGPSQRLHRLAPTCAPAASPHPT